MVNDLRAKKRSVAHATHPKTRETLVPCRFLAFLGCDSPPILRQSGLSQKTDLRTVANADGMGVSEGVRQSEIVRQFNNCRKPRWHKGLRQCEGVGGALAPASPNGRPGHKPPACPLGCRSELSPRAGRVTPPSWEKGGNQNLTI
jgi:hypothetical protein